MSNFHDTALGFVDRDSEDDYYDWVQQQDRSDEMWDTMKKAKESGDSMFIKLKDGDNIKGVFRGDPYVFYRVFQDKEEYTEWAEGRSFRFRINFMTEESGWAPKILEQGAKVRDALLACKAKYGLDCVYEITRTGSGREDTVYNVLFDRNLTDSEKAVIAGTTLKELTKKELPEKHLESTDVPF
jgi:hypothetical protein